MLSRAPQVSVHKEGRECKYTCPLSAFQDERNQVLTLYLWIRQEWTDAYLQWDPDAYGGLDAIRIPSSLVWRPDIVLYNKYGLPGAPSFPTLCRVALHPGMQGFPSYHLTKLLWTLHSGALLSYQELTATPQQGTPVG